MLSKVALRAFTFTPDSPRALDAEDYAKTLSSQGIDAIAYKSVADALANARNYAISVGCPVICAGSLYAYAEIIENVK